jgi:hypothetical protein
MKLLNNIKLLPIFSVIDSPATIRANTVLLSTCKDLLHSLMISLCVFGISNLCERISYAYYQLLNDLI